MKHLIYLLLLAVMLSACADMDSFLFNTEKLDHYSPPATIPDSLLEPVTLTSGGLKLYGYWIRSDGSRPGLTILYCHGNKHNMDAYWDRIEFLRRLGCNIFTFDYRGFGMSEGESSQEGMYADADAALEHVMGRGVTSDSLVLYGYSLGNVASIHLAANRVTPLCLIAESPFASSTSLAQGATVLDFPARWLTDGTYDNAETIRRVHVPLLLLHGTDDDFVRYRDNGKIVFENANEPKKLIPVEGADHTNVPQTMGVEQYLTELKSWINGNH
jgi:alpha-beta hydrolase superfamily lysophospholipase